MRRLKRVRALSGVALMLALPFLSIRPADAQSSPTAAPAASPASGSLVWRARKARKEEMAAITLGFNAPLYAEVEPLDRALLHNSVVTAILLGSETNHDERTIITWRKFKILEHIKTQSLTLRPDQDEEWRVELAGAPKSMLPLAEGEFVIDELGGTVTIEGIKITEPGEGPQNLPVKSRYLMFVLFGASGKLAALSYGPASLFSIDDSDTLHARFNALDNDQNPLLHEIRQRGGGKVSGFRALAASVASKRH